MDTCYPPPMDDIESLSSDEEEIDVEMEHAK